LFDGGQPPERRWWTSCYDDHLLAGDRDWFMIADSEGRLKRLYDRRSDPQEVRDVAAENPEMVDALWKLLEDEAGGTLPQFGVSAGKAVLGG
jgi:hypothetical protein